MHVVQYLHHNLSTKNTGMIDIEVFKPYLITFLVSFIIWYCINGGLETFSRGSGKKGNQGEEEEDPPPIPNNFTLSQLSKYTGKTDPTLPNPIPDSIYVSIDSTVFDVTKGREFYGPGGSYECFAGKEIGWALAKMSFDPCHMNNLNTKGMAFGERESMEEWIVKFRDYKGYPIVGRVKEIDNTPTSKSVRESRILSPSEISKYSGLQSPPPPEIQSIYVGVGDYVFDVSYGGNGFYLPGCSYAVFAGKDASVALAKMSFEEGDRDGSKGVEVLNEKERKVLADWIKSFRDKKEYPIVGRTGNGFKG
mmetsp:Transcript_718/g.1185  ORF Transcript_718/g.1185 Transcript_718/m.1185 type:complete len:307 (-) Transcript_718:74-994(-)